VSCLYLGYRTPNFSSRVHPFGHCVEASRRNQMGDPFATAFFPPVDDFDKEPWLMLPWAVDCVRMYRNLKKAEKNF
jgi:hypothetical protein